VSDTIPTSPNKRIDVVIGLDARGFLLGPVIALRLGAAFVPVRKRGKLPGECVRATYEKEYGAVRHVYTHPFFFVLFVYLVVVVLNATEHPCPHISQSWARRVVWCGVVADIFFGGVC
jgi:hypothetical protein